MVADLPVGENLQDQVIADGIEMFTPYSWFTVTAARAENFISAWAYSIFGTGIFVRDTNSLRSDFLARV